jgi:NAD-dependent deacetylase
VSEPVPGEVARARHLIATATRIVVLTGAGVSAESGVPTFRGREGLWRNFRPEQLATAEAFRRDPLLVWSWYDWRRQAIARCQPNAAHHALAAMAFDRSGVRIVTQNVDALHGQAARDVSEGRHPGAAMPLELHGCLFRLRCTECGARREDREPLDTSMAESLPRCEQCSSLLRPDVVWFGESLDREILEESLELGRKADVCLVVGTSALVYPAAGIALATAEGGGKVIEVNPEPTPLTGLSEVSLRASACAVIPELIAAIS